jgi:hypothetical protein
MGNLIDWALEGDARDKPERRRRKEGKEGSGIRYGRVEGCQTKLAYTRVQTTWKQQSRSYYLN